MGYLTEAGFYRALGQRQAARIADAELRERVERFQSWTYGIVLPQIRKTGSYNTATLDLSDPLAAVEAEAARTQRAIEIAKSERAARIAAQSEAKMLTAAIERDAPLVAKAEAHTGSDSTVHRQEFAREVITWGCGRRTLSSSRLTCSGSSDTSGCSSGGADRYRSRHLRCAQARPCLH